MRLGYINIVDGAVMDACMTQVVRLLEDRGVVLAGAIHAPYAGQDRGKCDMDLRILPDGPALRISQNLGEHSQGCRLDSAALEAATAEAIARAQGAEVLIINKFGKHEAEGRGFIPLIVDAIERDMPVIVGVNGLNLQAFLDFSDGLATEIEADPDQVVEWLSAGRH